jgi:hypothetical protein
MKLLRLTLVLLWTCFAQPPTAPPSPNQSPQTTIPGAGVKMNQAFFQAGNRATNAPDIDVAAIQRKGMIKADHKKNLDDAVALLKLAEELKSSLEKEDPLIISVKNIKRTEDIQKLAKDIHGRLKRY